MELQFDYQKQTIRTITDENEQVWFAGIDVCNILGYADSEQTVKKLDEDERMLDRIPDGSGQTRKTWTVNEFGLYSLILSSTKPEAKEFKRWVTHEILPSIRKAGKYTTEQEKNHNFNLKTLSDTIISLKNDKEELQKKINEKKKEIDKRTTELTQLINQDRSQTQIEF
ncbi:MAG: Bro-N domain-containing protein [Bacteroidales bacterium]|nr:Bro-N domain-containing protein [Bacteroidales bacterium]MDD3011317.1 Bro-N domain-containing protein [Bacteroidales bacterium]MDD3962159.1 Bro-N domain-containing protein [Bacteroidales bacterium]MDY0286813.1 Bro-N domain-containing protein [Bacteroidales bacterium]